MKTILITLILILTPFFTMDNSTGAKNKNYQCTKCKTVIQSDHTPSSYNCRAGGTHNWQDLGAVGNENYNCT